MTHSPTYFIASQEPETRGIHLLGCWKIDRPHPLFSEIFQQIDNSCHTVRVRTDELTNWDSLLIVFLRQLINLCKQRGIQADLAQIPKGARQLLHLADTVKEKDKAPTVHPPGLLVRIGQAAMNFFKPGHDLAGFSGEIILETVQIVRGDCPEKHFSPYRSGFRKQQPGLCYSRLKCLTVCRAKLMV